MGWFKKILNLAGSGEEKTEELEQETVALSELAQWVETRSNQSFEDIRSDVDKQFSRLFEEKKALSKTLEELNTAKLQNPNILERAKQMMEGNRAAYISQHKQFLNNVQISDEPTCKETLQFCKHFEDLLVKLAKSTAKGHAVMKEFFANSASKINKKVKIMGDIVSRLQELLEDNNVGVEDQGNVTGVVSELESKKKLLSELKQDAEVLNKKLSNSTFMKDKLLKKMEQLKQTPEYTEYANAKQSRERLRETIKQTGEKVNSMFSPLDRPMRKYERMIVQNADVFTKYLDDPASALAGDEKLVILDILQNMCNALEQGSLELKDKEKVKQKLEAIYKEKLTDLRLQYVESKKSLKKESKKESLSYCVHLFL